MLLLNAQRSVIGTIRDRRYFSMEQMSIIVRTYTIDYQIQERFIGIRECKEGVSAKALFDLVQNTMTRCMLDKENLLGCAFDGSSAMVKLGGMLNDYTGGQSL